MRNAVPIVRFLHFVVVATLFWLCAAQIPDRPIVGLVGIVIVIYGSSWLVDRIVVEIRRGRREPPGDKVRQHKPEESCE